MNRSSSSNNRFGYGDQGFVDTIFSWSLEDICNEDLYIAKVDKIDLSFESVEHYYRSFVNPLLEESRAKLYSSMEILSSSPFAQVISIEEAKSSDNKRLYNVKTDTWKNGFSGHGKDPYKALFGDVFILADFKPETVNDLQRVGRMWTFGILEEKIEDADAKPMSTFKVVASKDIDINEAGQKSLYIIFLTNIIPEKRIWNALHMQRDSKLMERVLCAGSLVVKEKCDYCSPETDDALRDDRMYQKFTSELNESQYEAISSCLSSVHCNHKSTVDLIWGPPGTGKTKTLGTLLFALLKKNRRTLVCAPTNVAIKEVASRVLSMARVSFYRNSDDLFCSLGDMLLFGNHEQLKVGAEIEDIYLDYRVEQLTMCFTPPTGWRYCFGSMIDLLENCVTHYHLFVENELRKEQDQIDENNPSDCGVTGVRMCKSFLEFVRERFLPIALQIRNCVSILCTHVARSYIMEHNLKDLACLIDSLDSFQALLFETNVDCDVLEELFSPREGQHDSFESVLGAGYSLYKGKTECMSLIRTLKVSLGVLNMPNVVTEDDGSIREFCLQTSSLIFSTASSSFKLHSVAMEPLDILVIDEAAQLKECESTIPLLLPDINYAILVGDERQLPAMVVSPVSAGVGFGRSLFQRLRLLGHPNHFLNIQYRMHPAISSFPNSRFYLNQILDAPNVMRKHYINQTLPGPMFGPYSFINIVGGSEEFDDAGRSRKNIVEVAVVIKIIKNCFKAWLDSKENLSIGVVSPYAAQVVAIRDMVGHKYDRHKGFDVKVKTIDGFQGGEHDIILLSTVRTDRSTSLKFISDHQRTNVALTRARHCLWILGNERTLVSQENVWKALVLDAKKRKCFFNADEDRDLAKSILDAKTELDQFDDLLNADSVIFRKSRWKVLFSDNFLKSFKKLSSKRTKQSVISLLLKLSSGWRPKKIKVDLLCGNSSQMLKQYKVEGFFVVCSKDIVKDSMYTQVLKIWDVLQPEDIPKVVKRLDSIFGSFTDDFTSRCSEQCFEGKMEIPMSWEKSTKIIKFKSLDNNGNEAELSRFDQRVYVENSKVAESLLLMKFYPLSSVVVSHLLSDCNNNELDLPFEVSDEERDIILFSGSSFISGRSGTGKTTILTMKLFHRENSHHTALEEMYGIKCADVPCLNCDEECQESSTVNDRPVLRQLFVTVSPKLCQAVKHHIGQMQRSICGGNNFTESSSLVEEDIADVDTSIQFKDVPDSFVNLPINSYPLVITFQKFLMMLDGTVENSYFERFNDLSSQSQNLGVRSVALETFIRKKEVTYDRFDAIYWPHFNSQYTKMLDSSRVFIEIISHIKGGMQVVEPGEDKLSREHYLSLSENRSSSLSKEKREIIYDIYQSYEKMKIDKGDFDMADIVADLHRRLRNNKYEGDEMHFVYIDEVQDLTMSQIALFKYVCQNVDEGFVFCGDTAQTIARGIDFRFQDIKSLFYKKFVLESKRTTYNQGKEKVKISDTFLLNQNFRTHAGVLKLSQSTIELLYRFFPHSVDVLKPETSVIYGEAPVVLECGSTKNAIETIFGNGGHVGGDIVGFGAEQVILVRDDCARKEILDYVGKQAIVLTILECKGLEFQDVLLYNFFGASPLENRWRVIYEYMNEQDMLDPTDSKSYPHFSDSKHNLLCSELKQLYVAITRTRQRLWICENTEEYCRPMFDYWKKKCLVQFKELDDSLAQAMKVASTPEEWKSRGKKLYYQNNYEMATTCFERAGDSYWEKKSKAAGLRATANRLRGLNPEDANAVLREAAEIFEGIGMADSAAQCFSDLGDYERAGKLYLEKCEEPDLKRAGDCFDLAGCYEAAAQVYARGSFFKDCLNVCAKGELFDNGLYYIQHWKQNESAGCGWAKSNDLYAMEQNFLESCARKYFDCRDNRSMMKFVRAFHSMDLKREFLQSLSLLDELLELEKESGNFMEAVNVAKMMGDTLQEADLLGKAGNFNEAYELLLCYVLANSLWSSGSKGWPLKPFENKVELLGRALSFAKEVSSSFYDLASAEAEILSNEHCNSFEIMSHLKSSRMYRSTRGEILCLWKLLEAHFRMKSSKYVWQDNMFDNSVEGMIIKNQFSVETLFYCWTCWKDNIVNILFDMLGCLPNFRTQEPDSSHVKFALNYLGVQKQHLKLNGTYLLLVPDAYWVMKLGGEFLKKSGGLVSVDEHHLVSFAQRFWRSELLSVGMVVLQNLHALYSFSVSKAHSEFFQFQSLLNIYEVSKFLLKSECFHHSHSNLKPLEKFYSRPIECFFCYVVPLDCKKSLSKEMVCLRVTETCQDLVKEAVYDSIKRKDRLTLGQIGRVVVMILSTPILNNDLFVEIMTRFADHIPWRVFIQTLQRNSEGDLRSGLMLKFFEAIEYTYNVNWRTVADYVSPCCFVYLIERLLLLTPRFCTGCIFGTKSSFIEWLISVDESSFPNVSFMADAQAAHRFIANVLREFVLNQNGTKEWIRKSNLDVKNYFLVLLLRMVVLVCLLYLISGKYEELIHDLLGKNYITSQLPLKFRNVLHKGRKHMGLEVIAEAFKVIDNPLIIVRLHDSEEIVCPDAMFVDLRTCREREIILQTLFPNIVDNVGVETASATVEASDATSKEFPSDQTLDEGNKDVNADYLWVLLENLQLATDESYFYRLPISLLIKEFFDPWIQLLTSPIQNPNKLLSKNETRELVGFHDEMKHLLEALNTSDSVIENRIAITLSKQILSRRPIVEPLLNKWILAFGNCLNVEQEQSQASVAADNDENGQNAVEESKKHWTCLWDWLWDCLESLQLSTDESCFNRLFPNSIIIKDLLDPCIKLLTSPIHDPTSLSKNETVELVCLHHKMLQLRDALSTSESVIENHIAIKLSKQILSRRSQLAPILYKPLIQGISNTDVDLEPSQASTSAGNDENGQNVVKKNKGKRKESKKNKGGNKGGN